MTASAMTDARRSALELAIVVARDYSDHSPSGHPGADSILATASDFAAFLTDGTTPTRPTALPIGD
ncbi:hypothetical protein [Mycolicibacterium sphagni]|uniref:hypothetical protein n=1 Tax=Mycolicibacterium sphagni TaxID=1786 RepID=UPI0021F25BDB|nr:hypothetical protein [Mycolicibacterium sphagni]MCV7175710.1 hypothetical protein [Mycolicibacterium sphagni]